MQCFMHAWRSRRMHILVYRQLVLRGLIFQSRSRTWQSRRRQLLFCEPFPWYRRICTIGSSDRKFLRTRIALNPVVSSESFYHLSSEHTVRSLHPQLTHRRSLAILRTNYLHIGVIFRLISSVWCFDQVVDFHENSNGVSQVITITHCS